MQDFWTYLFMRDKGRSHEDILNDYINFDKKLEGNNRGKDFEKKVHELFCKLYEYKIRYVVLITRPDDICTGPQRKSPKEWCKTYSIEKCVKDKDLLKEDSEYISFNNFKANIPITTFKFVNKIRGKFINPRLIPR